MVNTTGAAVEMPYELVELLSEGSSLYRNYLDGSEKAITILYTSEGSILPVLEDMVSTESHLISNYQQILTYLDENY